MLLRLLPILGRTGDSARARRLQFRHALLWRSSNQRFFLIVADFTN